jgi:hypothetical protein
MCYLQVCAKRALWARPKTPMQNFVSNPDLILCAARAARYRMGILNENQRNKRRANGESDDRTDT